MQNLAAACWALAERIARPLRLGRAGAVAVITAVCAPLLVVLVGFAADFGYASYLNQKLARATDAAALAAVSQNAATAAGPTGYNNTSYLQTQGVNVFNANVSDLSLTNMTFNLTVNSDGNGGVVATGNYSYTYPTTFVGFLGFRTIPLAGMATTTAHPVIYVDYYILVDTSQSMGIGATANDMARLYSAVMAANNGSGYEAGCVFGCHVQAVTNGSTQPVTNESLARSANPPIQLRIDAAVLAIQNIIRIAQSYASQTQNIRFALYAIQEDPTNNNSLLKTVASRSSNYPALLNAAATIDLGNNTGAGIGDSDFHDELASFVSLMNSNGVTSNGNGTSATSPLNYVFVLTDGASDIKGYCNGHSHCTSAFAASDCDSIKAMATVGTIYTTYLPIYNGNDPNQGLEGNYAALVAPFVNQIGPGLQACATSSNYYFEATESADIIAAMQSLFARTQPSSARITQ